MLKVLIIVLFLAVVASLFSGLNFLVKDLGDPKKRLLRALGIRIGLAATLLVTIIYGAYTGQIKSKAPWDQGMHPSMTDATAGQQPEKPVQKDKKDLDKAFDSGQ